LPALEPKPGIEPTSSHLAEVLTQTERQPVKMVVRAAYLDGRASEWIAQRAHVHAVVVPFTVGGTPGAKDLFEDTIQRLLAGLA
jgi:zinc/manganese transport system substrate-binding protein